MIDKLTFSYSPEALSDLKTERKCDILETSYFFVDGVRVKAAKNLYFGTALQKGKI